MTVIMTNTMTKMKTETSKTTKRLESQDVLKYFAFHLSGPDGFKERVSASFNAFQRLIIFKTESIFGKLEDVERRSTATETMTNIVTLHSQKMKGVTL